MTQVGLEVWSVLWEVGKRAVACWVENRPSEEQGSETPWGVWLQVWTSVAWLETKWGNKKGNVRRGGRCITSLGFFRINRTKVCLSSFLPHLLPSPSSQIKYHFFFFWEAIWGTQPLRFAPVIPSSWYLQHSPFPLSEWGLTWCLAFKE